MVSDRKRHEAPPKKRVPKVFVQLLGPLKGTYNMNNLIVSSLFHDFAGAGWAVTVGSHHDVQAVEGNIAALAGQVIIGHVDLILWYELIDAGRIDDKETHLGLGHGIATIVEAPHAYRVNVTIAMVWVGQRLSRLGQAWFSGSLLSSRHCKHRRIQLDEQFHPVL